jgi:hypothetical protein
VSYNYKAVNDQSVASIGVSPISSLIYDNSALFAQDFSAYINLLFVAASATSYDHTTAFWFAFA